MIAARDAIPSTERKAKALASLVVTLAKGIKKPLTHERVASREAINRTRASRPKPNVETKMANILKAWDQEFRDVVEEGIFPGMVNRMNIQGWSRTGKSTLSRILLNPEWVIFHRNLELVDFIGGWKLVNGTMVWVDGPAVRAMRQGRCLLIDEFNNIPTECETYLYAVCDDPARVTLPNGEVVEAQPGYCVVATMNPSPEVLPHPLYDRFDIYLKADRLSEGTKQALGRFAKNAEAVVGYGQPKLDWVRPATVNAFLAANKMSKGGVSDERIAQVLGWTGRQATDFLTAAA